MFNENKVQQMKCVFIDKILCYCDIDRKRPLLFMVYDTECKQLKNI